MATPTPFTNSKAVGQLQQFYLWKVDITDTDDSGSQYVALPGHGGLSCAYEAAGSSMPETWEGEAPANDRILIPGWHPTIKADMIAVLTMGGMVKRFKVDDVVPDGSGPDATLLFVTPKQ